MTTTGSRKIVVESAEAVLGLHWFVARDFTVQDEGIEIENHHPRDQDPVRLDGPSQPRITTW